MELFPGYSSVITPAPYNAKNAAATPTGSDKSEGAGSKTGSTTESTSSSTSSSTAKPNGVGDVGRVNVRLTGGIVILCAMVAGM